jgi:flagellar biogenesis protein FliO
MLVALAIVLGLMAVVGKGASYWLRGRGVALAGEPLIRVLGTTYLGPKQSVSLLAVAGEVFLVGATADRLVPLGRIQDPNKVQRCLNPASAVGVDQQSSVTETGVERPHSFQARVVRWAGQLQRLGQ